MPSKPETRIQELHITLPTPPKPTEPPLRSQWRKVTMRAAS